MAKIVSNPVVGQLVYEPFSPAKIGIIRSVGKSRSANVYGLTVSVEWVTPKGVRTIEKNINSLYLNDFDMLIADHQKKLSTHLVAKKRVQAVLEGKCGYGDEPGEFEEKPNGDYVLRDAALARENALLEALEGLALASAMSYPMRKKAQQTARETIAAIRTTQEGK